MKIINQTLKTFILLVFAFTITYWSFLSFQPTLLRKWVDEFNNTPCDILREQKELEEYRYKIQSSIDRKKKIKRLYGN